MKTAIQKTATLCLILLFGLLFAGTVTAEDYKANYMAKKQQNDATIGVIAGVINHVCPKLVPASTNICNAKDPVGSAVGVQKYMGQNWDAEEDDIEDADLPELLHLDAALQFWDAVEQFKLHFPYRKTAADLAAKAKWEDAFLNEEMAFQYLVKCASRGIFAQKMVDKQ